MTDLYLSHRPECSLYGTDARHLYNYGTLIAPCDTAGVREELRRTAAAAAAARRGLTAVKVTAIVVQAECPCGGMVMDADTGSYDLSPGEEMVCEDCDATIVIKVKTARLMAEA